MSFVVHVLVISTIFAAVCFAVSNFGSRPGRGSLLALLGVVCSFLIPAPLWFLQCLATSALLGLLCLPRIHSRWATAFGVLLPLIGVCAGMLTVAVQVGARRDELRRRYPVVSLASRLEFERDRNPMSSATGADPKLPDEVERRLARREFGTRKSRMRTARLQSLHQDVTSEFVAASGFGFRRGPSIWGVSPDLPPRPLLPLRTPTEETYRSPETQVRADAPAAGPSRAQVVATHESAENDFLNPLRFGYAETAERAVGFESHGFAEAARFRDATEQEYDDEFPVNDDWSIVRLELVSLLKHDPPAVYVSKTLPQMDELKDAPTRPLEAFERSALEKLRRHEHVVVEESAGVVRMLGALRAGTDCLACHRGSRGDLLGAFSYELHPAGAPPQRPNRPDPQARVSRSADDLAAVTQGSSFDAMADRRRPLVRPRS